MTVGDLKACSRKQRDNCPRRFWPRGQNPRRHPRKCVCSGRSVLDLTKLGVHGRFGWYFSKPHGGVRYLQPRGSVSSPSSSGSILQHLKVLQLRVSFSNLQTRNSVHYSCPRFWYPVYWMCIEYKDCVYNCWDINVWSLLLTFKCYKMLLEDGVPDTTVCTC